MYARPGRPAALLRRRPERHPGAAVVGRSGGGGCLDVSGGRTEDGTKTQLWDCLNNPAQKWRLVGNTLVNPNSGKCLDVANASTANGTRTILWQCGTGSQPQANQVWQWR
ncbi:hypothetical protein F4553_001264 [Allocatelliglobosispora scoriae]|uniref:Ricin B lectin domain-containing protein n=1 Tax=Allocatelliglobosispora scoriae TaxID=643052 RepID=A0A841BJR9_9ACTN|nr:RICIN domain-containing protein [Allocatelliglobosispora scoriae]MBB5867885.1 hypothetical protein [Allocatelliglobosispora scoriae]